MSTPISRLLPWAAAFAVVVYAARASALSMQECSVKYKAAQAAGTLDMKWNDFRKAECAADDTAAVPEVTTPVAPSPRQTGRAVATTAPPSSRGAIFPRAVSPQYASEPAGRARMHTCRDQYNLNKTNGGNGDLKWTEKGGGYYSECNQQLTSQ